VRLPSRGSHTKPRPSVTTTGVSFLRLPEESLARQAGRAFGADDDNGIRRQQENRGSRRAPTPQALRDVEAIRDYVAADSPRYAGLVVERIFAAIERLSSFPESGRVVPERNNPEIREVIARPYRVVYRLQGGAVEIATVFRSSRMFPELK
jgi:plasmid stabilization system protein ParE